MKDYVLQKSHYVGSPTHVGDCGGITRRKSLFVQNCAILSAFMCEQIGK